MKPVFRPVLRITAGFVVLGLLTALQGCGFQPLYATATGDGATSIANMQLVSVTGRDVIADAIENAFERRTIGASGAPAYELRISARELAQPVAVQIDATVTRFTYEIVSSYVVRDVQTGESVDGRVRSVASFNIVTSQYSTLVAERAAREKAARQMITQIERDALTKLSRQRKESDDAIVNDPGAPDREINRAVRDPSIDLIGEDEDDVWGEYAPAEGDTPAAPRD